MKIIINESKLDQLLKTIDDNVNSIGIDKTAREIMGMDSVEFIDRFGYKIDDKKITDLIDTYMEDKFDKIYNFISKHDSCGYYSSSEGFMKTVVDSINEYCYNSFNFTEDYDIDEESVEFENLFYKMEHYIVKKYGNRIEEKYIEICGG